VESRLYVLDAVERDGDEGGHAPRAALYRGGIWRDENMEF